MVYDKRILQNFVALAILSIVTFLIFSLKILFLLFLNTTVWLGGTFLFMHLEGTNEAEHKCGVKKVQRNFVRLLCFFGFYYLYKINFKILSSPNLKMRFRRLAINLDNGLLLHFQVNGHCIHGRPQGRRRS